MRDQPLYFSPRLLDRLRSIDSKGIAYVEAPAGYGKTVAVRHYLRINRFPVLWVSALDSGPGNRDLFWRDLCHALEGRFSTFHELAQSLLKVGYPHEPAQVETALEILEQLPVAQPTVLVIDDLHLLRPEERTDAGILRLCELLAIRDKLELRLVLISRHAYGDRSAMLQVKGILDCIPAESFALNAEEIAAYFSLCGAPVNRAKAGMLHSATGGWINALYLMLLHFQAHGEFSCPSIITALLRQEVYLPLSVRERRHLICLSVLDRFTGEQAESLAEFLEFVPEHDWRLPGEEEEEERLRKKNGRDGSPHWEGAPGGAQAIRRLTARNAFIRYDEGSRTYMLYAIFRDFLQCRFMELPEELRGAIHRHHAAWFIRQGNHKSALVSFSACGDWRRALEMLESEPRLRLTEQADLYGRFFHECPDELLLQHPAATFKYALFAFINKDAATFRRLLGALEKRCAAFAPDDRNGQNLRGEVEMLRSCAAFNNIAAMAGHHRRASRLLRGPSRYFGVEPWTLGSPSVLFLHHCKVGKLNENVTLMLQHLPAYSRLTSMHGAGGEYQMLAEALFFAGEFDKAEVACRQALAMAKEHKQLCVELCALLFGALLALIRGAPLDAGPLLRHMHMRVKEQRDPSLLRTIDLCRGFLYAFQGQYDEVPDWLWQSEECEKNAFPLAGGINYILYGRLLLSAKKFLHLLGFFSWVLTCGKFDTKILLILNAHLFMAAAHGAQDAMDHAADSLRAALALALPDKLYMPFAAIWELLLPVFQHLEQIGGPLTAEEESAYATIRNLGTVWLARKENLAGRSSGQAGQKPHLTRRELQLARLAATGKTYPEIAKVLGLAPNTVKKVFSSIFRKNNIHGRHQLKELLSRLPAQE